MRVRAPFIIFPRSLPSGKVIFYYSVYEVNGKRKTYSTGETTRNAALRYCIENYKTGSLQRNPKKSFSSFASGFFIYNSCQYIQGRIYRGSQYSKTYARQQRAQLLNSILPTFGYKSICEIRPSDIEEWLVSLKRRELSHVTINHYLSTLRIIFHEAFRLGEIDNNPSEKIRPFIKNIKEKGILSMDEVQKLFNRQYFAEIWNANEKQYLLNLTAACTGMRMGELLALKKTDISPHYVHVSHSWERVFGEKGTKTGKSRNIPIPVSLYRNLVDIQENRSCPYIFSHPENNYPYEHRTILKWLYKALEKIGIDNDQRIARNITFHSWRHYFNTMLRLSNISDIVTRKLTGHHSEEMMEHYTHLSNESLQVIIPIQKEIMNI